MKAEILHYWSLFVLVMARDERTLLISLFLLIGAFLPYVSYGFWH